jgi:hypothetical protein
VRGVSVASVYDPAEPVGAFLILVPDSEDAGEPEPGEYEKNEDGLPKEHFEVLFHNSQQSLVLGFSGKSKITWVVILIFFVRVK